MKNGGLPKEEKGGSSVDEKGGTDEAVSKPTAHSEYFSCVGCFAGVSRTDRGGQMLSGFPEIGRDRMESSEEDPMGREKDRMRGWQF